jgi:hypothetical protein
MLEAGVPVVFGYIEDAHDDHSSSTAATFGPGEAGYVTQLAAFNDAFGKFFARLAKLASPRKIRSLSSPQTRTIILSAGRRHQKIATA